MAGVGAHQQPALTARGDGHVPADEERETAEHLLLGQGGLTVGQNSDAIGEVLVVRHGPMLRRCPASPFFFFFFFFFFIFRCFLFLGEEDQVELAGRSVPRR